MKVKMKKNAKPMRVLLLLNIITLVACNNGNRPLDASAQEQFNSQLNYVSGQDFDSLPMDSSKGSIRSRSQSVVGIRSTTGDCSGVVIGKNLILTAGHCLATTDPDSNLRKLDDISKLSIYLPQKPWKIDSSAKKFKIFVPHDFLNLERNIVSREYGMDIAIIKFNKDIFENYVPHVMDGLDKELSVKALSSTLFNPTNKIYAFSWGSHKQFQVATPLVKPGSDIHYAILPTDQEIKDQSVMVPPKTWNLQGSLFTKEDAAPYFKETKVIDWISNTNRIVAEFDGENGDSGGPLFICTSSDSRYCDLVGIGQTRASFTSTSNPYLEEIYSAAVNY